MRLPRAVVLLGPVVACVGAFGSSSSPAATPTPAPDPVITRAEVLATTVGGRRIRVVSRGRASATVDMLVVGVIHGNETAGLPIVRRLGRSTPPPGVRYWLISSLNPDGVARGSRQNLRGVDLNRNFPHQWRGGGRPFGTYFPGRARASERETRALLALVRRIRPDATVWYHQHLTMVLRPPSRWRVALARRYEAVSGLRMASYPGGRLYGTASSWQHAEQPRSLALVVELPAGALQAGSVVRHADAVRALAVAARDDAVRPR